MARAITAGELVKLRADGQFSRLYLAILKPNSIYTSRLATAPTSNDNVYQVAYNTGSGTLADVKAGMTLYVGTSAGAYDLGMCRIRAASDASYHYIGMCSDIKWDNGGTIYLTIVDDFGLWVKPAYNTKLDYNVTYSDQNSSFDPVPMLGAHQILWLTGATVNATFAASDSWVIGSTISSYLWVAPGASATANLATATPTITYNAAGVYRVYCTVTAANGKSFMGVRYVFVYTSASMPVTAFQLKSNPRGDYEQGGWTFDVTLYDEAQVANIRERTMVILFAKDYYQGTEESLGPVTNRENILAMGWVSGESIVWDHEAGSVDFQVQGPAGIMKQQTIYQYPLKYKSGTTSTSWMLMPSLDVRRALFQLLHWRSTVTQIMDVTITSDARAANDLTVSKGNLWGQVDELAKKIYARPGCDRYGRLFVEIEPNVEVTGSRTWASVLTLTTADWQERISLNRRTNWPVSHIAMTGQLTNTSGKMTPMYSLSQGHIPMRYGTTEAIDKMLVTDQSQANTLCGMIMGWRKNEWPEISFTMPQNNRFVDCWPRQFIALAMSAGSTPRNKAFSGNLIPRAVEYAFNPESGDIVTNVTCEGETFAVNAVTGDAPAGNSTPPTTTTDPPTLPPPVVPGDVPPDGPRNVIVATSNFGMLYTINAHEASPSWFGMNAGLTTNQMNNVRRIIRTPSGALFALIKDPTDGDPRGGNWIYWTSGLGGAWQLLASVSDFGTSGLIIGLGYNPMVNEEIAAVGGVLGAKKVLLGSRSGLSVIVTGIDGANNQADVSFMNGKWFMVHSEDNIFASQAWSRFTSAGSLEVNTNNSFNGIGTVGSSPQYHMRFSNGYVLHWNNDSRWLQYMSDDPATTASSIDWLSGALAAAKWCMLDVSVGGRVMGGTGGMIGQRSSDFGASWGNVGTGGAGGMTVGFEVWANGGDDDWWFSATTQKVVRTSDFGDNWEDRTGDLSTVAPLCGITHMLVMG